MKRSGKVAAVADGGQGDRSNSEQHELFVWEPNANAGYGVFVAAAMKRSQDDDEEDAEDRLATGGAPSQSVRTDDVGGEGGSRKGKGKGKADRERFLCGQKGHFKSHCPNRWHVPKTQWSSWWNTSTSVWVFWSYPDQEPYWSEEHWSAEGGACAM